MENGKAESDFIFKDKRIVYRASVHWEIEGFSDRAIKSGEFLKSPLFWSEEEQFSEWYLKLYPNGDRKEIEGFLSVILIPNDFEHEEKFTFRVCLLDSQGKKYRNCTIESNFINPLGYGFVKYIKRGILASSGLLAEDKLVLECDVEWIKYTTIIDKSAKKCRIGNKESAHSNLKATSILNKALSSEMITLKCENRTVKVHKELLKVRSLVFDSMLTVDMKENNTNEIIIADMSYQALMDLVEYFYVESIPEYGDHSKQLLMASDKYEIEDLKAKLEDQIIEIVDSENYLELLNSADLYRLKRSKNSILSFIKNNIEIDNSCDPKFQNLYLNGLD